MSSDSEDDIPLSKRIKTIATEAQPSVSSEAKPKESTQTVKAAAMESDEDDDVPLSQRAEQLKSGKNLLSSKKPSNEPKSNGTVVKPTEKKIQKEAVKPAAVKKASGEVKAKPKPAPVRPRRDSDDVPLAVKAREMRKKAEKTEVVKPKPEKKEDSNGNEEDEEGDGKEWWQEEYQAQDNTVKWTTLEHYGVCFPPDYVPHKVPLVYAGQELVLEPEAEEVAGFFGALIQTDHAQNEIFVKNFFEDFKSVLRDCGSRYAGLIKDFSKCDFTLMFEHFERLKEKRKAMTKEDKAKAKAERQALIDRFGFALVDGRKERIGNFMVEPPGLFRGRGKHPKAGKLKLRVRPEQITINIGKDAQVPLPPQGHRWGSVQHDNTVTWLATWVENINRAQKYVFLAPESSLKGRSDMEKFEKARKLKSHVKHIRKVNAEELRSKEMLVRQRATALWLIDHLALRAGNEKGDDEADTVGCCSLRCEHVRREEPNILVFDFLGKDSIRYYNEVPVDPIIYKNIGIFMRPPKTPGDLIFDRLTTSDLNKYLSSLMPGLTAKVFRTYNASFTFQEELAKTPAEGDVAEKVLAYNRANRQVAILCNHQKSVSKTHGQSMENMRRRLQKIKYQRHLVKKDLKELMSTKELKSEIPEALEAESDLDEETMLSIQTELDEKAAERVAKKLAEAGEDAAAKPPPKSPKKRNLSKESLQKSLARLTSSLNAAKLQLIDKDENKTTALSTSKTNYIDPRITVAWCGGHEVPVEKLFPQTLRKKFQWAMNTPKDWQF